MSFSSETKASLVREIPERECCLAAEFAGMALFSGISDDGKILFKTENAEIAELFQRLSAQVTGMEAEIKKSGMLYQMESPVWTSLTTADSGIKAYLVCEKCGAAFFRGAFLAAGFVNPPEKPARLELSTADADLACGAAAALTAHFRLPKLSARRGKQILYYRDAESVEYFLSYIGANKAAFAVMNAQMLKEKRREINRKANFELANLSKTVNAAALHTEAIRALMASGDFEKLSPELRRTAKLRLENDTMTLSELAALENPPVSKSQISKRLQKIYDFYRSMEKETPKGER